MRFPEFLRASVMTCGTGATALVVATLVGIDSSTQTTVTFVSLGWWVLAVLAGIWLGRSAAASEPIQSLLAGARTQSSLPELQPTRTLLNRLWPVMLATVIAAGFLFIAPQVPAVVAGLMIILSLSWRHQSHAVKAIEDRDGARFYVDRTPPLSAIRLVRTPGFRAIMAEQGSGPTHPHVSRS
ncbi:MAG: hypothetical protein J2O48_06915 [Solirubrobacterales bacterium]|nr:hypothetical protein [Solirubrobacterales bacterium]